MTDWQKEYRDAQKKRDEFEKRIKSLEQRMDNQYDATKKLIAQASTLESVTNAVLELLAEQQKTISSLQTFQFALREFAKSRDAKFDSDFQEHLATVTRARSHGYDDEQLRRVDALREQLRALPRFS